MTGLEILAYIYLSGWLGTSTYMAYDCYKNPPKRVISQNECYALSGLSGAMWPCGAYYEIDKRSK